MKKCTMSNDLNQRLLEKWNAEVEIMSWIDHDNIVKALTTPAQLLPKAGEPPILVMEYCSGGDLRNVSVFMLFHVSRFVTCFIQSCPLLVGTTEIVSSENNFCVIT